MEWETRKIDWEKHYYATWDHPHRHVLVSILAQIPFLSLWEVGVGGGANLVKILKTIPKKVQLGGCDVNEDAVEFCRSKFNGAIFHHEPGDNMLMSDKSVDIVLTDMTLIYVKNIDDYIKEFKRVARSHVVLCEFHSTSFFKRLLARWRGYNVYDYRKLLERHGFYNIQVVHIPEAYWPGTDKNTEFRSIITAQLP